MYDMVVKGALVRARNMDTGNFNEDITVAKRGGRAR